MSRKQCVASLEENLVALDLLRVLCGLQLEIFIVQFESKWYLFFTGLRTQSLSRTKLD